MQLWNNRPFLKTWKFSSAILANWINPTTVALLKCMTEFLYEDRKTYFSGTKGPSAKNEVFIGGGVHSDQPEIRRRSPPLLNCSNSQMPNRSGILTILSNSSRLSLMILAISPLSITSRRDTNDYRSAFFNVNSVVDPFSLVLRCHWWWFTI